jgi:MFS family permease
MRVNNGFGCAILIALLGGPSLLAGYLLHSAGWAIVIFAALIGLMLCIAALPIGRKVSPQQYADELEHHLLGTEGEWDWDQTSSVRLSNPHLEQIRRSLEDRFDSLSTSQDREDLRRIIDVLRIDKVPNSMQNNK